MEDLLEKDSQITETSTKQAMEFYLFTSIFLLQIFLLPES